MKIPKEFQLGGTKWTVQQHTPLVGAMGATFSGQALVQIDSKLDRQIKEQTFLHELCHCIFFAMGKTGEAHDEVFIDGFATLLHQYMNSAK